MALNPCDLTQTLSKFMDRHLLFPILDFHKDRGVYAQSDIMAAQLELIKPTNMADFAADIYKALHGASEVTPEMKSHRSGVVARLKSLQAEVDPIIKVLENPSVVRNFRQDKAFNLQVRHERRRPHQSPSSSLSLSPRSSLKTISRLDPNT